MEPTAMYAHDPALSAGVMDGLQRMRAEVGARARQYATVLGNTAEPDRGDLQPWRDVDSALNDLRRALDAAIDAADDLQVAEKLLAEAGCPLGVAGPR